MDNLINIKYKLSIYNKVNYYQLLLINDINSSVINIVNNYNTNNTNNNIILFNSFYKNILETKTQKNIINLENEIDYDLTLHKYNIKGNILFLSNFNNIFSKKWSEDELHNMFNKYRNLLFIIDETFINENDVNDNSMYSCSNCINSFHNILVIKTLSNIFDTNIKYLVGNVKYLVGNVKLINSISIL